MNTFNFKPITDICLNVTEDCNMGCIYCFTEHHPHRMSYKVAKDTVDWLLSNVKISNGKSCGSIGFFGGEPLLEWDTIIVPLTKYIREELKNWEFGLGITSNCLLLNETKLQFMKKYNIDLLISMDGNKNTQDINRPCKNGQSSFDILNEKMPLIYKYFPYATYRSTLIPSTCQYFCENLDYAKSIGFQNTFVIINQFEEWDEKSRKTTEEQVRQYSNYLIYCMKNGKKFIRQRTLEQALNKIVANNCKIALGLNKRIQFEDLGRPCGLGSGYGSINYAGDIFTCQEVASRTNEKNIFHIGNIYTGIDRNKQQTLFDLIYSEQNVFNEKGKDKCKECPLELTCNVNSCLVNNYIDTQTFHLQSDNLCWWNNLMAAEAQYICQILGNENNENFEQYFNWILTSQGGAFSYD